MSLSTAQLTALQELRVADLKTELEKRSLDTKGVKAVLVDRLRAAMEKKGEMLSQVKQQKVTDESIEAGDKDEVTNDDVRREDSVSQQYTKAGNKDEVTHHDDGRPEDSISQQDTKVGKKDEVTHHDDVRPEDSISQQGTRVSRRSSRASSAGSFHSTAREELMRSAARKAGLQAKMEALKAQAAEESQLQNLIRELEFKKQQGALLAQMAEEDAQQKVYVQCGGSMVGSVKSVLEKQEPAKQTRMSQILNVQAPVFEPKASSNEEKQHVKKQQQENEKQQENEEERGACGQQDHDKEQSKLLEVLLQTTERSQLPATEVTKFRGDAAQYFSFIHSFDNRIGSKHISDQDKLYYLQQYTEDQPKEIVRGCLLMPPERGYQEARRLLHKRYGNEENICAAHIEKLMTWPTIKPDNISGLQNFAVALMVCDSVMSNMPPGLRETDHPRTLRKIVEKLPFSLHDRWRRLADAAMENERRRVTFSDLVDFVDKEARVAANPLFGRQMMTTSRPSSSTREDHRPRTKYGLATSAQVQVCTYCKRTHKLEDCEQLRQKELAVRKNFIQENGLCYGCLETGHLAKGCKQRRTCRICGRRHVTLLHQAENVKGYTQQKQSSIQPPHVNGAQGRQEIGKETQVKTGCVNQANTGLAIVPVVIRTGGRAVITHALLDSGSTACFCQESLLQKLGLQNKSKTQLSLTTVYMDKVNIDSHIVKGLEVTDLDGRHVLQLPAVYSLEKIPVDVDDIPRQEDLSRWPHLSSVELPRVDAPVELMIGNNVPLAMEPWEIVHSENDGPYATKTVLGWVINGPVRHDEKNPVKANRIQVQADEGLSDMMIKLYNTDFNEKLSDVSKGWSVEDEKWHDKVERSIKHKEGHFEVGLPMKKDEIQMPRNRKVALQRLNGLKKKMLSNETFMHEYKDFMRKMMEEGYAEEVPVKDLDRADGRVWYIPHHGVYHPHKPNKIRIVFDCAAKCDGVSLNDVLLQGPDMTSSLLGVLLRFRSEPVAFMADIRSMFYQVKVPEPDRDLLRFLWWPEGDVSVEPRDFRMTVHIFGAASSPSCSNFALRRTVDDCQGSFSEEALDTVRRNFYVDDCLRSVSSEEEAQSLATEVGALCATGGFYLTKYVSNKEGVLDKIPQEDRDEQSVEKGLDLAEGTRVKKALGIKWNMEADTLGFCININTTKSTTRRQILSVISSVYDPLGIAGPFTLAGKLILQELVVMKLGWDEDVPAKMERAWKGWLEDLPKLEALEVKRSLKPEGFGQIVSSQLHHFSDASMAGYGAVSYLRLVNDRGQVHCAMVMAKSRVAPLKKMTVPRLELAAATVAVRLNAVITKELEIPIDQTTFWTDSTTVLRYLNNTTARYQIYVANRLAIIKDESSPSQWRFVPSEENPADDASRGVKADMLLGRARWLSGPDFLTEEESKWPRLPDGFEGAEEHDPDVINSSLCCSTRAEEPTATDKLLHHYSEWYRLKKAVAWILRFKKYLQTKRANAGRRNSAPVTRSQTRVPKQATSLLSVKELEEAEAAIIQHVQRTVFASELQMLKTEHPTSETERKQGGQSMKRSHLRQSGRPSE